MKVTEIDKPILTPIKLYVDVESFYVHKDSKAIKPHVPEWVKDTIDRLSFDFEWLGLLEKPIDKSYDPIDFVHDEVILDREHWGKLLSIQETVLFYYERPSVELMLNVPEFMRFPFTSNIEIIKDIVTRRVKTFSYVNKVSPYKRGRDNKYIKFIKDMF